MIKQLLARLLPQKNHFHGGLHITPPRHKSMSTAAPSREAVLSAEYAISLRQRDGSAYLAKVAPGERVLRGQLLAEPVNTQDAPVHAPTSGTIRAIESRPEMHPSNLPVPHLILDSDGKDESVPPLPALDPETTDADTLRERIAACGIVGLGGAGFPTARKLGHPANTLVINAAECEPYITCDDLQIRENAADIIHGAQIAAKILGAEHIHFGIEDDKPQAIAALERAAADIADPRIQISSVPTRYPSGNARQLFELLLGVRVPADKHASDYGLICHNSGTMKAVYDAVIRGEPLTERYTTISGEGVKQPQVLRIRTGAPARDLIAQAGGETGDNRYIIGGPMMGYEIASADTPLQKTGNSLLLLPAIEPAEESPCIRCSRCADACPMELLPQQLLWYSQSDEHKRLKQYRLFDCIECGICAAVCPSAIPLVQYYRHSKGAIRAADEKARAAEHARTRHEARTARLEREAAERQAQMDARRAKLQQNPAADKPERYTPAKPAAAASPTMMPPPPVEGSRQSSAASDDKTAAIEAAKARAAARRAERLAAQNEKAETSTAPTSRTEVLPPSQDALASAAGEGWGGGSDLHFGTNVETSTNDKTAAIEAAKARAAARRAERLAAQNSETAAPHQLPPDPGKTTAIEAVKARAAARKAARLAQQPLNQETSAQNPQTPPQLSRTTSELSQTPTGGGSAAVAEPPTAAAFPADLPPSPCGGGDGGGVRPHTADANTATDAGRPFMADNNNVGHECPTYDPATTDPAPHQLPPDPDKTAAIEAAKARAAARKAARLAQQPLNQETSAQHPLTPPQLSRTTRELSQSPTGGGSAAVAEPPTAAASPAALPPSPRGGGDGGGVRPHTTDANTATDVGRPFMADNNNVGHECPTYNPVTTVPAPHQLPSDPGKTAAIEAAKARAAARRAERLAAQNEKTGTSSAPTSRTEVLPPSQDAPASAAGEGWGGGSVLHSGTNAETSADVDPAPHQLPPAPGKTAAIEAAKARAAARKAARLAQQSPSKDTPERNPQTPPQPSPTGGGSLSVAESPTAAEPSADLPPSPRGGGDGGGVRPHTADAETSADLPPPPQRSATGEGWGGGSALHSGTNAETSTNVEPAPHQLPPDPGKIAAIEAAKARAAARKAARLAQNSEAKTPANLPPSPRGGGDGGGVRLHTADANTATDAGRPFMADNNNVGHECPTYDPVTTDPAPHQLPSDPGKTTAIEAAKARAAARKAAHLAQQPLNEKTSAQHPLTPPHPSPTGGGSLSVAEPPTVTSHPENNKQPETPMNPNDTEQEKQSRDAKLAAARAKSAERRIAHAKLKQHMRDTAVPIRPQTDDPK